ncbi:MAG: SRPBCC domain-containing protein [Chitinophagaceae bacterium]|nr:SRPBCC domain-containing protein [Chitinophagaceae bacterium]
MIRIRGSYAEIAMPFTGEIPHGMLLWLDEDLIKEWWNLSDVKIEPRPGGIFYLRWGRAAHKQAHAMYGIMDRIDVEANSFSVSKIIYVTGEGKMTDLHLDVSFVKISELSSIIRFRLSHQFDHHTTALFKRVVMLSWPGTFRRFKEFAEV